MGRQSARLADGAFRHERKRRSVLITSRREVAWVILLILILCVFRDAESARECSGVHETSIANLLETRMNRG